MQIIFAGILLAKEPPDGGTDGVLGFELPEPMQIVQDIDALRGADSYPQARGNRKRVLTGTIRPKSATTLAEAHRLRNQWYETLPWQGGALLLIQDTEIVTFAVAVLERIGIADNTEGTSYGLTWSFRVGPPSFTSNTNSLTDSGASPIEDSHGNALQTH